ncbi:MAG: NusG domain II-containing protein [Bacilli bacterium]|nr:NusG domain II-containing protein [Bacilli bacterium]
MNISLKPNKHDIFVLAITLLLIITSIILMFSNRVTGNSIVVIKYNNQVVHTMRLDQDERFTMKQEDYDLLLGDLTVEVKNGKVAVVEQTSNHNYCELMGENDRPGTAIICAPNGVVITIVNEDSAPPECDWGPCMGGE